MEYLGGYTKGHKGRGSHHGVCRGHINKYPGGHTKGHIGDHSGLL